MTNPNHPKYLSPTPRRQKQRLGACKPTCRHPASRLDEGQYPEVGEQIQLRGWRRLSKPRTKISKDLVLEFYTKAVRTEEELDFSEDYPYTSFVRGTEVNFSAAKIREVLRIRHMTFGLETDFKTRQYEDQRLDEVIRDICMPGAQWKMRNKSKITVARAVLIHSIIKGHDVRVEELIADNIAVLADGVQGRSKLCFSSTIYRLCKEAGVPMGEFKNSDQIQIARPITAKVMTTTRGRIINQPQNQPMEEDEDNYDAENLYTNHEQNQEMHYEAEMHYEGSRAEEDNYQHQEQPNFAAYESNFQQYKENQ
ncbi:hypothetical protein PIB30_073507 [Stylosanthes scabra]|uniref:Putative plant transposon protein domain-containing protein n=1 Tax=Stylosanthes scabra TaxID=79078 RepID=A0ABU6UN86_9FABA|nr:hypothetical protein [Stylosanthes scabra]